MYFGATREEEARDIHSVDLKNLEIRINIRFKSDKPMTQITSIKTGWKQFYAIIKMSGRLLPLLCFTTNAANHKIDHNSHVYSILRDHLAPRNPRRVHKIILLFFVWRKCYFSCQHFAQYFNVSIDS